MALVTIDRVERANALDPSMLRELAAAWRRIAAEEAIYDLDGPVVRITTPHVPLAANPILEDAQMPSAERIAATVRSALEVSR